MVELILFILVPGFPFGWVEDMSFMDSRDSQDSQWMENEEMQIWFEKILFHVATKEGFIRGDNSSDEKGDFE